MEENISEGNERGPPSKKAKIVSTPKAKNEDRQSKGEVTKDKTPKAKSGTVKRISSNVLGPSPGLSPSKKRRVDGLPKSKESGETLKKGKPQSLEEIEKKKRRMKSKALLKAVEEQMEFYFSDSNLSKDRFLRKLYDQSENGFIDLAVFKNFNKLQQLTKEVNYDKVLYKALAGSTFFELNKDGNKVKRRTPFVEVDQEEIDRRTIYVEHLPNHASHAWIRKIFSQSGKVCYVSLPVYQTSKEIKGFAFVEFSSAEEAQKACNMLNNPAPSKTEEKPGKFPKGNKFLNRVQKIAPGIKTEEHDSNEENLQSDSKEDQTVSPIKKKRKKNSRRKSDIEDSVDENEKSASEQTEIPEEKKKRKKRKKKHQTETAVKDGETNASEDNKVVTKIYGADADAHTAKKPKDDQETSLVRMEDGGENMDEEIDREAKRKLKKKNRKKLRKLKKELDKNSVVNNELTNDDQDDVVAKEDDEDGNAKVENSCEAEEEVKTAKDKEIKNDDEEIVEKKLSRKERKLLRQEDIRRKKAESQKKEEMEDKKVSKSVQNQPDIIMKEPEQQVNVGNSRRKRLDSLMSEGSETDDSSQVLYRKSDGSQLTSCLAKQKKQDVVSKKVEFDPVPITTEFVERKEVRRRKKQKRESLHLRVISKEKWLSLRGEYIRHQKSHMAALKESLRDLRMKENANQGNDSNGKKHVDLTNVFGTKRMKPSQDVKLAHLEQLKFIPNVIVQWKCSHEINRNKIKNMFPQVPSERIAYVEGKEEAKSGYIRFKDEESAEEFAKLSRSSDSSFNARVLPESQQASYWEKANADRKEKLSKKKNERGSDRIARKVFERNKATFHEKGSHIVFDNEDNGDDKDASTDVKDKETENKSNDSMKEIDLEN